MKNFPLVIFLTSIFFLLSSTFAEENSYRVENSYRKAIEGLDPMDLSEVDPKVAGILRKYYQYTYGDSLTWEEVESLRVEGEVELMEGTFDFVAYRKKPNFMKVVIHLPAGGRLVFGYDGKDAWQLSTEEPNAELVPMPDAEALNFVRDAVMGGHLLYPQVQGKEFEFVGTASVEGDRVFELKTTLPGGQVIRSFFDMTSFAELYQETTNNVNQTIELNVHSDFRKIEGIRIPFSTILKVGGEQVHQIRVTDLQVNSGVMPWVFSRSGNSSESHKKLVLAPISRGIGGAVPGSSFSIQSNDIWSTTSGVVGSAFQIESVASSEDQARSVVDKK